MATVRAYDPVAMDEALAIMTEWMVLRSLDFDMIKSSLKEPVIFDERNIDNPAMLEQAGLSYTSVGRRPRLAR